MRLHGNRPTFRWFHRSRDSLLPYSKQCPSINAHLRFAICARKEFAALGPRIVNTHAHGSCPWHEIFPCALFAHVSLLRVDVIFFFTRGRCNVRNATYEITFDTGPSLLVLGPCSSLVPPRLTETKIKIINVSFDAWTFSLTGKRREIN